MNDHGKPMEVYGAGKGDKRRSRQISREEFEERWNAINWKHKNEPKADKNTRP